MISKRRRVGAWVVLVGTAGVVAMLILAIAITPW
jgi:hypothetical protein